jgi:hypothetical protein
MEVWEVEVTDPLREWWASLTSEQQEAITDRVDLLEERGPDLGRPVVDRIHESRHQNTKELRASKDGAAPNPSHVRPAAISDPADWSRQVR